MKNLQELSNIELSSINGGCQLDPCPTPFPFPFPLPFPDRPPFGDPSEWDTFIIG